MNALLSASAVIDRLTAAIGRYAAWGVLAACIVAAANAIARKLFGLGSNAWLETQWLLFSAVFLLAAPWTLASKEHIRIDILTSRLAERRRAWLDLAGHVLFLVPVAAVVVWTSLPFALTSYAQHEGSSNFGGLPQWPLKALIPIAFALLLLQAVSEIIKTVAILTGTLPNSGTGPATSTTRRGPSAGHQQ